MLHAHGRSVRATPRLTRPNAPAKTQEIPTANFDPSPADTEPNHRAPLHITPGNASHRMVVARLWKCELSLYLSEQSQGS